MLILLMSLPQYTVPIYFLNFGIKFEDVTGGVVIGQQYMSGFCDYTVQNIWHTYKPDIYCSIRFKRDRLYMVFMLSRIRFFISTVMKLL